MSNASPKVFIAYARADTAHVEPIAAMLRQRGYTVFFDPASVHGGGDYVRQSQRALADTDALIVCWTRAAAQSPWIESEARAFQSQLARGGTRRLIPVWLDTTPLPTALTSYDAVDGSSATPATTADMLAQALGGVAASAPPAAPAASASEAAAAGAPTSAAAAAQENAAPLFVAFARADREQVESVVDALRADGQQVWFESGAHGGGDYVHQSQRALAGASGLVVFWSSAAARSPWVETELRSYQASQARRQRPAPVFATLDATPMPATLAGYRVVDAATSSPAITAANIDRALTLPMEARAEAPAEAEAAAEADAPLFDWDAESGVRSAESEMYGGDEEAAGPASSGASWSGSLDDTLARAPVPEEQGANVLHEPPAATPPPPPAAPPPPPIIAPPVMAPPEPPIFTPPPAPAPGSAPATGALPGAPQPITQPRGKGATTDASADALPGSLEQVTFTAYHPREIQARRWEPMLVFISLDTAAAMALVAGSAAERLGAKLDQYRPGRSAQSAGLGRGAKLRIIPSAAGIQFNPEFLDVTWQEDAQQHEFRMRAESAQPGQAVNGVVQFYQGLTLRGEVPISVFVGQAVARLDSPEAYQQAIARAYRHIFASYSHQDTPVVESCESAARSMGDQFLRDVTLLQSGQQWDPRLIQAINDADVFQLFWSRRAAASPFVEREWKHALMLLPTRPNFIRPVYWSRQLYPTPPELNPLHFQPLSLSSLGWGSLRAAWYSMRNG